MKTTPFQSFFEEPVFLSNGETVICGDYTREEVWNICSACLGLEDNIKEEFLQGLKKRLVHFHRAYDADFGEKFTNAWWTIEKYVKGAKEVWLLPV